MSPITLPATDFHQLCQLAGRYRSAAARHRHDPSSATLAVKRRDAAECLVRFLDLLEIPPGVHLRVGEMVVWTVADADGVLTLGFADPVPVVAPGVAS